MINKLILRLSLLILLGMPCDLLAWGNGHDYINEFALTVMPPDIKAFLGEENARKFVEWSHAPDDFTPWSELEHVTIHAEELSVLSQYGMETPYALHSYKGHAVNYILLVKAFQAFDPERSAFWMATLMHVVADELACNHDPLIHFMTYGFMEYGMDMGDGIGVDFADIATTSEGAAIIQGLLEELLIEAVEGSSRQLLLKVMLSGIEGNASMTQRGSRIAASYAENATDAVRSESMRAMAELGVKGIQESMDMILSAWNSAPQDECPEWDALLEAEYRTAAAEFGRTRPLQDDSLFTELIAGTTTQQPFVGALVEPSVSMNLTKLGFSSKLITASAVRTMRKSGVPCRLLDLRALEWDTLPDVTTMPLLLICAGPFNVSTSVKTQLQQYTQDGGKLLWIGGEHKDQLGALSLLIQRGDDALLPVSSTYGEDSPAIEKAIITFRSDFGQILGDREYRFTHNPNTRAGWQKPVCPYIINGEGESIVSLAELKVDESVMTIAAAGKSSDGTAQYIFLPEYLVSPYLLSGECVIQDPSNPVLDSVGTKLIPASINILLPEMQITSAEPNLIVHMDFNDANGVPSLVNTGTANVTGVLFNATLDKNVPSVNKSGYSVRFNQPTAGCTNYVNLGDIDALDGLEQLTISTWIKQDEVRSCRIISKGYSYWDYQLSGGSPITCIELETRSAGRNIGSDWKYIAFTYDGTLTTNNCVFYEGDGYTLTPVRTNTIDKGAIMASSTSVWLGDSSQHNGGRAFSGWMDNVRIYDEIVSPAALAAVMAVDDSPNGTPRGPVVQLDFNEEDGVASLANHGSVNVTGTFQGDNAAYGREVAPVNRGGPDGYSGSFEFVANTTEDRNYVDLGDVDEIDSIPKLTVCTWLRGIGNQGSSVTRLAAKGWGFEFALNRVNAELQTYRPQLKIDAGIADGSAIPITNEWVFVAVTFDGTLASDNTIYYTGTDTSITKVYTNTISKTGTSALATPLYVGDWNGAGGSRAFNGYLDNFRIYDRILDSEEIHSVMRVNDSPPEPRLIIQIQ